MRAEPDLAKTSLTDFGLEAGLCGPARYLPQRDRRAGGRGAFRSFALSVSVSLLHTDTWGVCVCVSVEWALCEQMPDLERVGLGWAWLC